MMKSNPWSAIPHNKQGIDSVRVNPDNPFDFFWALGKNGEYLFIIEHDHIEDWPTKKIALSGIEIQQFQTSKGYRLSLKLNESSDWDIFYILCNDLPHKVLSRKTVLHLQKIALTNDSLGNTALRSDLAVPVQSKVFFQIF